MLKPEITVVLGVDIKTIKQLAVVLPTWRRHKPALFEYPWLVFYDRDELFPSFDVLPLLKDVPYITYCKWPTAPTQYPPGNGDKWSNPQRHKMLAGFVHVPPQYVRTDYWLKIDTDMVATGGDEWIDPAWFVDDPAIICSPWGYTKPADQMLKLDTWAEAGGHGLEFKLPPLNLVPSPGADYVRHHRIISQVALFNTAFTATAAKAAAATAGPCMLPVPSQDGYMWYVAKRLGCMIKTPRLRRMGWESAPKHALRAGVPL